MRNIHLESREGKKREGQTEGEAAAYYGSHGRRKSVAGRSRSPVLTLQRVKKKKKPWLYWGWVGNVSNENISESSGPQTSLAMNYKGW